MDKWRQECEKTRDELETQLQRMKQEKSASEAELKGDLDSLRKELDSQRDRAQQVHKAPLFIDVFHRSELCPSLNCGFQVFF